MIKKTTTLILFLIAFFFFSAEDVVGSNLSLVETHRILHALSNEIIDFHTVMPLGNHSLTPSQEAVLVLVKKATMQEIINTSFYKLPRDFLIKAVTYATKIIGSLQTPPLEFLRSELSQMAVQKIISLLQEKQLKAGAGRTTISYTDVKKSNQKQTFYHTIIFCPQQKSVSVTFFSNASVIPPLSRPSYSVLSTQWRQESFPEKALMPFSITFNGTLEEGSSGAVFFTSSPKIDVTFYKEVVVIPDTTSSGGFFSSIGGFFNGIGEVAANSWQAVLGATFFQNAKQNSNVNLSALPPSSLDPLSTTASLSKESSNAPLPVKNDTAKSTPSAKKEKTEDPLTVEINSASKEHLMLLNGIGETYAQRIMDSRPFCSLEELTKVSGIGEATLAAILNQGLAIVDPPEICTDNNKKPVLSQKEEAEKLLKELQELWQWLDKIKEKRLLENNDNTEEDDDDEEEEFPATVEINSASKEHLVLLNGIGETYAQRIMDSRPFCSLEELTKVSGIGEATLAAILNQGLAIVDPPEICTDNNKKPVLSQKEEAEKLLKELQELWQWLDKIKEKRLLENNDNTEEDDDEEEFPATVEINSANKEHLILLNGIGETYAQRIMDSRPFCSLEELTKVSGIGEATLAAILNQGLATVNPPNSCFEENDDGKIEEGDDGEEEGDNEGGGDEEEFPATVEINSASKEHLVLLNGIGETYAQRIIDSRPFCSLEELTKVSGIGEATLAAILSQGLAIVDPPDSCFNNEQPPPSYSTIIVVGGDTVLHHATNPAIIGFPVANRQQLLSSVVHGAETVVDNNNLLPFNPLSSPPRSSYIILSGADTAYHEEVSSLVFAYPYSPLQSVTSAVVNPQTPVFQKTLTSFF